MGANCCNAMSNQLCQAIASVAETHNMRFDREKISATLEDYAPFFFGPSSYVQLRIARKGANKTQLNYRGEVFSPEAQELLEKQLLPGCQLCSFLGNVMHQLNTCATAVDGDAGAGVCKLWQAGNYSINELAEVDGCPPALATYLPFFAKHGMARVYFTGIDLQKRSMNCYFSLRESGRKSRADILEIFTDLGFAPPSDEDVLDCLLSRGSFAMTLSWDSEVCERACFYMMNASTNQLPNEWKNFALECTLPHEHGLSAADVNMNSCFVSCSFGRREEDQYLKQESDWHGDYLELLSKIENFEPELPDSTNEQRPC